jgi:alpha/beta superfamily hydrolase/acyltransferase
MGGMVAQEVTRLSNDLVDKLILVGTGPRDGEGINNVTSTTFKFMLKAGIHRVDPKRYIFYNHDNKGKEEANKVLDRLASRSKENADTEMKVPSFLRQLKAIKNWSTLGYDDLKFIKQPTLIVNGDKDLMVPTVNSYNMHQKIENSKLIIYPNAAHGSLFQYADEFSKELIEFLGE